MIETIDKWLTTILGWLEIIPIQGWAILAGIFIGGVVTQWIKRTFPVGVLFPSSKQGLRVMVIRITALVFSFLPTYYIWPADNIRLWAAIAVGFGTPTIYRILTFVVYKKWPDLEARLSGTSQ